MSTRTSQDCLAGHLALGHTRVTLIQVQFERQRAGDGIVHYQDFARLFLQRIQFIVLPLAVSPILLVSGAMRRLSSWKDPIINRCFFLVTFTVIRLNSSALTTLSPALLRAVSISVV